MPADTRQYILEAAAEVFMRRGYAGSGLQRIADESACPIGSVYHFFPGGKQELAAETLRWAGKKYQDLVAGALRGLRGAAAVEECFRGAAVTLEESDYADACPIATVALDVANTNEELRLVTAEIFATWLTGLTNWLVSEGIGRGKARALATTILAALEGGFLLSRAAKSTAPMNAIGQVMSDLVEAALPRET